MKTYPFPKPLSFVSDSEKERTELIGAAYGLKPNGEKYVVPQLWLHGDWLRAAGFEIGDQVAIQVDQNQLIIMKLEL